ncbi:SIR2 family protein [Bradyrhizobium sp. Pear76]|uniref:SIR2 family protein n=1 Tax=Bradyrhizobium oropedii TaxID=1571201 RepID=UPI001E57DEEE|nr:SIR2 family protein [Bradyrhizobium oropedii]MCC8968617.1 SIR2 family protein [Bradyrhizobium oropedii]
MTFILLTGAGFSYNWGGPLASEAFSSLLADPDVDEVTRERLFAAGFEQVLADLHLSGDPDDKKRHDALLTAVVGIFNAMNNGFMHVKFEFEDPPQVAYSLQSFLSRFHALFTLNQDALIEQHYAPVVGGALNWGRLHLPGVKYMPGFTPSGARQDKFAIMEPNPSDFAMPSSVQPYVKLHGSVNWVESSVGQRVLIMGGQKAVSIGRYPLLTWYHAEFRKMLLRPSARLMVIGYSFGDAHINDAIAEALKQGLKLFIVDPYALDVLKKDPRMAAAAKSQLIGFSPRPLSKTFGGDRLAHAELSKFFDLSARS